MILNRMRINFKNYGSNAFLELKVSYINQIADLCEKTTLNVRELSKALGLDRRFGRVV